MCKSETRRTSIFLKEEGVRIIEELEIFIHE
jgi:hypothetical protein